MQPLVFVHGYLGGSDQWADQRDAFSQHYDLITPDLPGYGNNARSHSPDSINGYARYVLDYVSAKGVDKFALMGHSMGGMIVQEMTAIAPERVSQLVLYGTGPIGLMPGRYETIEESARRVVADGIEATARRIAATWFMELENGPNYEACAAIAVKATEQAALAGLEAMKNWSGESYLEKVSCPTLVIWGDGDRAYTWQQPESLWQNISGARLAVVPGCSHAIHMEKPGIFNDIVLDFLLSTAN